MAHYIAIVEDAGPDKAKAQSAASMCEKELMRRRAG